MTNKNQMIYIESIDSKNQNEYYIGIDTYDEGFPCYNLMKICGKNIELIEAKTLNNPSDFEAIVNRLAEEYNATIFDPTKAKSCKRTMMDFNHRQISIDAELLESLKHYKRTGE